MDRVTERTANSAPARSSTTYSDIMNHVLYGNTGLANSTALGFALIKKFEILLRTAKEVFGVLGNIELFILKFHMLPHIPESLEKFGDFW